MNLLPLQAWRPSGDALSLRSIDCHTAGEPLRVITEGFPALQGVSGFAALLHARGQLGLGRKLTIESVLGTRFEAWVEEATRCGPHAAIVPGVEGEAQITGRHEFLLNPHDPLNQGFLLR